MIIISNTHKPLERLLVIALFFAMLLGLIPMAAFAQSGASAKNESGEIIAFEPLAETVAKQTVPVGTSLDKLTLPGSLTATIRVGTATDADLSQVKEPEPSTEAPITDSTLHSSENESIPADSTASVVEPDAGEPSPNDTMKAEAPQTTETTAPIPVTWVAQPAYDGEKSGTYIFAAQMAGYTVTAEPPEITVTVCEGAMALAAPLAGAVCNVNGVDYTDADKGIQEAFFTGGSLKLLQNIDYNNTIGLGKGNILGGEQTLTIDLNGYTLNIYGSLIINYGSALYLVGEGDDAKLNVIKTGLGAAVTLEKWAQATVSSISASDSNATQIAEATSLSVSGNVMGNGTALHVGGGGNQIRIKGSVIATNANYGIYSASTDNYIQIDGDVRVIGSGRVIGAYVCKGTLTIEGGIYLQEGNEHVYVKLGHGYTKEFSIGEGTYNATTGYFDYNCDGGNARIKGHALTVEAGTGGIITTNTDSHYEAGRAVSLSATPKNKHFTFDKWVILKGEIREDHSTASTTFTMPSINTKAIAEFNFNNILPTLKSGVPQTASARVTYGDTYTLNLSDIFTDAEGDPLTYKVSVNNGLLIGADSLYTYIPTKAGITTLKFYASDGYGLSEDDTYTVTLTVEKITPSAKHLSYNLATKTYNGLAQPPIVKGTYIGLGEITLKYDGSTIQPKDAKTYTVTASIAEGENFTATTEDITLGNYTIERAALSVSGIQPKSYDGTTDASGLSLKFLGRQNDEILELNTDYTVTNAQYNSADAGYDKIVTGMVELIDTGPIAKNYFLESTNINLTSQTINKAMAPSNVSYTIEALINREKNYDFDLTKLLPNVGTGKSLGELTYVPMITQNAYRILDALSYTSGNTLTIPVKSTFALNQSAQIAVKITSTNYEDFFSNINVITVEQMPLTVTGLTVVTKAFDGNTTATLSGTPTLNGIEAGDIVSISGTATATFDNANAGTDKAITITGLSLAGKDAAKYRLNLSGFKGTITPRPLTITPIAGQTKVFGETDPVLTYSHDAGSLLPPFTGELSRVAGEGTGSYTINLGDLKAGDNYSLTLADSTVKFTITPKPIIIMPTSGQTKVYGEPDPVLTYIPSPALLGSDEFNGALSRVSGENVGAYKIMLGSLDAGPNYELKVSDDAVYFTIMRRTVNSPTIELSPSSYVYDGSPKTPTVTVKDGATIIPSSEYMVSYSANTDAGDAIVTIAAKAGGNYTFNGTVAKRFAITKAQQPTLNIDNKPTGDIAYGDTFSLSSSGGIGEGTVTWAVTTGNTFATVDANTGAVNITGVGAVTITATKNGDSNYENATATYSFTTVKAIPNVGTVSYNGGTIYPTTNVATVNDKLQSTGSTPGTLSLATGTGFTIGSKSYTWIFTPADSNNYHATTGTIQLTVVADSLLRIEVTTAPTKMTYVYGDAFDPAGMVVTATYASGDTKAISESDYSVGYENGGSSFRVGETSVTLSYIDGGISKNCHLTGLMVNKGIPTVTVNNITVTYNGRMIPDSAIKGSATFGGQAVAGSFAFKSGESLTDVAHSGSKTVVFTPTHSVNYAAVETDILVTIHKATITISAKNKTAYIGQTAPNLSAPVVGTDYTVTGLAPGETLKTAPTLTYDNPPDMNKAGTYTIHASGADVPHSGNYNSTITYVDGILTIKSRPSGDSGYIPPELSIPTDQQPNMPTIAIVRVAGTLHNGTLTATITEQMVKDAIKAAQQAAQKAGKALGGIAIVFDVTGSYGNLNAAVEAGAIDRLREASVRFIKIGSAMLDITLDARAIAEIDKQSIGMVTVSAVNQTKLSKAAKKLIGARPVCVVTINYVKRGKIRTITNLRRGNIIISIPYALDIDETTGSIFGVAINRRGSASRVKGSNYDATSGRLIISTRKLSLAYGVGYKASHAKG